LDAPAVYGYTTTVEMCYAVCALPRRVYGFL
jgi:hypothetical protein